MEPTIRFQLMVLFNLFFISPYLLNPHFFDAGEEGSGFETQEFGGPSCAIDFPVGLL